jgi:hypothetical protein
MEELMDLFPPGTSVCVKPVDDELRMPLEVFFQDGEVEWAPGGDRDNPDVVVVPLAEGTELARVDLDELMCVLVGIEGVVPEGCRTDRGVVVEPLKPDAANGTEVRWELSPSFHLVHSGRNLVRLVAAPGTIVGYDHAATLDGDGTWRFVRALAALRQLRVELRNAFTLAADATREQWGKLLEAGGG